MAERSSPFVFEDAVPLDLFFDRREEIEFFVRSVRVKRKLLLAIVAPLKYGKSSLMRKFFSLLENFDDIIAVYVDLKRVDRPIFEIVRRLKDFGLNLNSEYRDALRSGSLLDFFERLNDALVDKNLWLFLFFDEFHLLPSRIRSEGFYEKFEDGDIFGFFRGFAEGARISYVVCGSVIEPLMDALDVWGGRFQVIYLGPFDRGDAVEMIKEIFKRGGLVISDEFAEIIAESAGYHPFYIQYMGHHIYMAGEVNRLTIREAKQRLYEYLLPLFISYVERINKLGREYMDVLIKIVERKTLTIDDLAAIAKILKIGLIRPRNANFEIVDPLFERYLKQIAMKLKPVEVTVVGHWAERIVGNYLLRRGYTPYYSHDSRGAFDIYVKIGDVDVGIQVKYTSGSKIYLRDDEAKAMIDEARKLNWKPILAVVGKEIDFYSDIRSGEYSVGIGCKEIEECL